MNNTNNEIKSTCPFCNFSLRMTLQQIANEVTITCPSCLNNIHIKDIDGKAKEILSLLKKGLNKETKITASTIKYFENKSLEQSLKESPSIPMKPIVAPVACPYCGVILEKIPQRKTKCLSCLNYIYVRTRPSDRQRVLVTEEGAKKIDDEWTMINVSQRLKEYGISEEEFASIKSELTQRFNQEPFFNDIIWAFLQKKLLIAMKNGDWSEMSRMYFEQAIIRYNESKDFFKLLQESRKCDLNNYQIQGVKKVQILSSGETSCKKCQILNALQLTIKQALQIMPIPVKDCENEYCRCIYIPVLH
jgi:hypothetical protein